MRRRFGRPLGGGAVPAYAHGARRGRFAVRPLRGSGDKALPRRKRTVGMLLRKWRENCCLIHRRVGRSALPGSRLPFVWRAPVRGGERIRTWLTALKWRLSFRYGPTFVSRSAQTMLAIVALRGATGAGSSRLSVAHGRLATVRVDPAGRPRRTPRRPGATRPISADRHGPVQPPRRAVSGGAVREMPSSRSPRPMTLRVGIRPARREPGPRITAAARAARPALPAPVTMCHARFVPKATGPARHAGSRRLRDRARSFRLVPGARRAVRFRTASGAAAAPLAAVRRADQARRVLYGSATPPQRVFTVAMQPVSRAAAPVAVSEPYAVSMPRTIVARPAAAAPPQRVFTVTMQPVSRAAAPVAALDAYAVPMPRMIVARPAAAVRTDASPARMTLVAQRARPPAAEIDRKLIEENVIQTVRREVSKNLARTVDETVRRQFVGNRHARGALIERLGSELYDRVVLERERLG
jgi:hypothetical protein